MRLFSVLHEHRPHRDRPMLGQGKVEGQVRRCGTALVDHDGKLVPPLLKKDLRNRDRVDRAFRLARTLGGSVPFLAIFSQSPGDSAWFSSSQASSSPGVAKRTIGRSALTPAARR